MKPTFTKEEATKRLTPEFLYQTFEEHSKSMLIPLTWIEFLSYLEVTDKELNEKAEISAMWSRLLEIYKMKCKASVIAGLKKDSKSLLRYYELEYRDSSKEDEGLKTND